MAPDCYKIAGAALCMTGSTPNPREQSVAHFARVADGPTLRAALEELPFVALVAQYSEPGDWFDEQEAAAVLMQPGVHAPGAHGRY
jgi:hypothetical protein